jgi:hypothetical protein
MKDLDKVREIFLTDVDEETKAENLEQIREWEKALADNEAYQGWREHDITKNIAAEARKAYTDISITLATRRDLSEPERLSLYARQDAMRWLLSHSERDAAEANKRIQADIRLALQKVS